MRGTVKAGDGGDFVADERGRIRRALIRVSNDDTLRLLAELRSATDGDLTVRLVAHPIAVGIIATDSAPDHAGPLFAVFAGYYTYQAHGEPKFVLQPGGNPGYQTFVDEAEALWNTATPHHLNESGT